MKKILNFTKRNLKVIVAFIIGIMFSGTFVYATSSMLYASSEVEYDNTTVAIEKSAGVNVANVQEAIEALYEKASSGGGGPTMTLSSYSGTIGCDASSTSITVTSNSDGAISCLSSNTSAATCSVSGTTVTITRGLVGSATITVLQAAGTNHAETYKTYSLTVPNCNAAATLINNYTTIGLEHVADAYRYVGTSPDNYVLFNCTNDSDPSTCEEWRIIGVYSDAFKGDMLKIVRGTPSTTSQKYRSSGNAWNGSDIQSYLVNTYYPSLSTTAKGMIEESVIWKVGAVDCNANAGAAYTSAGGTNWTGKIGLVASYEYQYAAGSSCQNTRGSSYNSGCASQDWLWPVLTNNMSSQMWFMSPYSADASGVLAIRPSSGDLSWSAVYFSSAASPVVYLKSTVTITGGNGKSGVANAYRLG